MDVNNNENTGIVLYANLFFDFLMLSEPFNQREVKKLGAICNKYLNRGTASTQKAEYLGGIIHWISGADVNTHLIETYWQIGQYIVEYPISQMPSHQLSWSHYVELLKLDNDLERGFYEKQAIAERWSVAELKRQKASALFLRLAAGKDKEEILKLGQMNLYMGYFANEEELRRELEMICQTEEDNG